MTETDCVLVLTTLPAEADVEGFAAALVEERLAACVAIHGVRSVYRWEGGIERTDERQLVMKTTATRAAALADRIGALHPYEVPELLIVPVTGGGAEYLKWIGEETGGTGAT